MFDTDKVIVVADVTKQPYLSVARCKKRHCWSCIYLERDATSNNDHCKLQNVIKRRNAKACKKNKIWYKTKVKCDI